MSNQISPDVPLVRTSAALLRQRDVKDMQGRKLDDAILRYVIENIEDIAELVLDSREKENL
ncbi:hypothetical protein DMJ13_23035 [halophilic archaeon]|nr:hypothetical protein DMJ13_23035 [halophilic archaeon]